jgi:hypothetical protein
MQQMRRRARTFGVALRTVAPLLPLLWVLASAGCSPPKAVRTYEFINAYGRMTEEYDPVVSLVYLPRPTNWARYRGIAIGHVAVGHELVADPDEAGSYATFFRLALREELLDLDKFDFVSLDSSLTGIPAEQRDDVLLFEGMVTKMDFGSGLKRYLSFFAWFFQSGATDLQIEGRITNAGSGVVLAELADRRRSLCNTPFGPNPKTLGADYAMKQTARKTAECLAQFIAMGCDGLPAVTVPKDGPDASNRT